MPTCSVCHDLQSSSLRIAAGELQRNLSLCKPCSLLHDGIAHFLDFSQVSRIDLFVDIALYAKLQLTGKKRPRYVEYSTSKGELKA